MLNRNSAPQSSANADAAARSADSPSFGLDSIFETQARLWNHFLDANRSLWSLYTPWLQATPWMAGFVPTAESDDAGTEPAQTVDGLPDVLESQTRAWNHMIDANRRLWTSFNWPLPAAPWIGMGEAAATRERESTPSQAVSPATPRRPAAARTRTRKPR